MSHARGADKLLIKPAAGAGPEPPHTRGQIIRKARSKRPVTRRVTRGTATTRLAIAPDRPTLRVSQMPEAATCPASRSAVDRCADHDGGLDPIGFCLSFRASA
jgi:hypothetical protein